jgi:uncharacterized protein (TIGR00304 family)
MNLKTMLPVVIFVAGIAVIALAVATGEARVELVLIFPVFSGSSGLFLLGVVLILLSFITGFALLALAQAELLKASDGSVESQDTDKTRTETKYGGVVLIGPVPIAFGSERRIALAMLVAGIVVAVIILLGLLLLLI